MAKEAKTFGNDFWYIQVGPSYFTGMNPVLATAKRSVVDVESTKARNERLKDVPTYMRKIGGRHVRIYQNGTNKIQWVRSDNNPIMMSEDVMVPTGSFTEGWSTELKDAKHFRVKSKAVAKSDEIAKSLNMDKVRPQVLLHKGIRK